MGELPAQQQTIMAIASAIGMYGVWILKRLVLNVEALNEKMAVMMMRVGAKERLIDDHEARLRALEHGPR